MGDLYKRVGQIPDFVEYLRGKKDSSKVCPSQCSLNGCCQYGPSFYHIINISICDYHADEIIYIVMQKRWHRMYERMVLIKIILNHIRLSDVYPKMITHLEPKLLKKI